MTILKHKDAYIKSFKDALLGNGLSVSYPSVDASSPYYVELNEEQDISTFAYNIGKTIKDNLKVESDNNNNIVVPDHNHDNKYALKDHNHDSVYAKIIHNHDDRYYTKAETELWRDALINGDLLFNKINSNHIQAGTIVAGSTIIANGAIGDAQISKLSADKLYAGIIDTSNITIAGANGNLRLQGNRLQVFEGIGNKRFERVSLGDVNDDGTLYGLRVRGKDGVTVLYDENGVYNEGITDGAITNNKISGDANIDGAKLNIESVINNINDNETGTIHGVKIDIDGESLDTKLFEIVFEQEGQKEIIERQEAQITQNKKNISLKVDSQKYTEDMTSMTSRLEKSESDINVLNDSISLTVKKTELENEIKDVKDFVSNEIGDISIGAANYINNSAPRKATVDEFLTWDKTLNGSHRLTYWQDYNESVKSPTIGYHPHIDLTTFHFPCIALINKNAKFNLANRELSLKQIITNEEGFITPNTDYTISFDAYTDTPLFSFHGGLYHKNVESNSYNYHSGRMNITVNEEDVNTWKRYSYTFKTHKGIDLNAELKFIISGHNNPEGSGYVKNIKLESGKIGSAWTCSQFDVDDSLDDVVESMKEYTNSSIKESSAELDVKLNGITQKVSSVEKTTTTLGNQITDVNSLANTAINNSSNALDKANNANSIANKNKADISNINTTITQTTSKVASLETTVNGISGKVEEVENLAISIDGKVTAQETRLKKAEQKITSDAIVGVVEDSKLIQDINGEIKEVSSNVSKVEQTANSITQQVSNLDGKYTEIKQTVDSIDLTGVVTFSDLKTSGKTTINGSNITTGTINGNLIRGGTLSAANEINFIGGARIFGNQGAYEAGLMTSAQQYNFNSGDAYFEMDLYAKKNFTATGSIKGASSVITGTASIGNVSTNGLNVYGATSLSGTLYTSGVTTLGSTLNVKNAAINGMNKISLSRGSVYIPNFSSNTTMDYLSLGNGYIACTDGGVFHLINKSGSRNVQIGSNQTLWLPHSNGNVVTDMARFGGGIIACPSSGSFHFLTASGATTPIYSGQVYSRSVLSIDEPEVVSEGSVFDKINSVNVLSTSKGLRLHNPVSSIDELESSMEIIKTSYDDEKGEINTDIDYTSAIATLWKAVQELKEENNELKKLIKGVE